MKKIYITFASLAFFGSAFGQYTMPTKINQPASHEISNPHPTKIKVSNQAKTAGGPGHIIRGVLAENIIDVKAFTSGTEYNVYANCVFMDSTVKTSDATGSSNVFNMKAGASFDPISIYWGGGVAVATKNDAYTVDSLWIGARYRRVNHSVVDTLLIECAWSPSTTATVWEQLSISTPAPAITGILTVKTNSTTLHGNNSFFTAPTLNYKRIKYPLRDADTNRTTNLGYIVIPNVNQLVPAGNIFGMAYTFVPGQVVAAGAIAHQYTGGTAQTTNGLLGFLYSDPATTSNRNFYDNTSKSVCMDYYAKQRYGLYTGTAAFLNQCLYPSLESGWDIGFSVSYNSTVGSVELEKNGFALGQNVPNPFTSGSAINYELSKDAKSVVFTITDVTGRIISTEKVSNTNGNHTVNIGSFAAGVYYYSLNVDGNVTTKKMIAQ